MAISLPYPQAVIESGDVKADALISIRPSPINQEPAQLPRIPAENFGSILCLEFDDIALDTWTDRRGTLWTGPVEAHLQECLAFARAIFDDNPDAFIAVHCKHGKSRSAAIALAITADCLGAGREAEAVDVLLKTDELGKRCFNPLIIRQADRLLARDGALENALATSCPRFVTWRDYWVRKFQEV